MRTGRGTEVRGRRKSKMRRRRNNKNETGEKKEQE